MKNLYILVADYKYIRYDNTLYAHKLSKEVLFYSTLKNKEDVYSAELSDYKHSQIIGYIKELTDSEKLILTGKSKTSEFDQDAVKLLIAVLDSQNRILYKNDEVYNKFMNNG